MLLGLLWDSVWLCLLIRLLCSCGVTLDDCLLFGVYDGDLVVDSEFDEFTGSRVSFVRFDCVLLSCFVAGLYVV